MIFFGLHAAFFIAFPKATNRSDLGFENADGKGEQDLHWGKTHRDFVAFLETHIRSFCEEFSISEDDFYEEMESRLSDDEENAFLPVFLLNVEYEKFIQEMRSRANKRKTMRTATQRAVRCTTERTNFSGVWEPVPEKTSDEEIEEFMRILKIPWYIRKMWKRSMKKTMSYTIIHTKDFVEMTRAAKFYGVRTTRYTFDTLLKGLDVEASASYTYVNKHGEIITDLGRGKAPATINKRFGPPGSSWRKTWKFGKSNDEIVRIRNIQLEDGTSASFHTYYRRAGSSSSKSDIDDRSKSK